MIKYNQIILTDKNARFLGHIDQYLSSRIARDARVALTDDA